MLLQGKGREDNRPRDEALAAMGLRLERAPEPAGPDFELLPCVAPSLSLFAECMTQWQVGPAGGATGLRREAVLAVLQMRRVPRGRWGVLLDDVNVCEAEALAHFAELRGPVMAPLN